MLALALDGVRAPALVEGIVRWLAAPTSCWPRSTSCLLLLSTAAAYCKPCCGAARATVDRPRPPRQAGRAFGFLLVGLGLLDVFAGVGVGGLWFVFLGWFLLVAARTEHSSTVLAEAVADGARARTRVLATQLEDASLDPRRHLVGQLCGLELRSARPAIPWLA